MSDTSTLSNDQITVTVSDTTLEAEVRHLPSGAAWAFRRAHGAELRVNHGQHTSTAHLSDAREIRAFRYTSLREQRLTYHVTGLPGDVALSVTYALPQDEPVLRVEIAPLPTSSASRITDVWFPGQLFPEGHALEGTLWPNMSGTLIPAEYGQDIGMPEGDSTPRALANHHALHPASDRSLYQPWWGLLAQGGACVAIAETDLDFRWICGILPAVPPTLAQPGCLAWANWPTLAPSVTSSLAPAPTHPWPRSIGGGLSTRDAGFRSRKRSNVIPSSSNWWAPPSLPRPSARSSAIRSPLRCTSRPLPSSPSNWIPYAASASAEPICMWMAGVFTGTTPTIPTCCPLAPKPAAGRG